MDVIEASSISLPPGIWPQELTYKGQKYEKIAVESRDGELLSVTYANMINRPRYVKVFND